MHSELDVLEDENKLINKLKDKSFYNANYSTVSKKRSS